MGHAKNWILMGWMCALSLPLCGCGLTPSAPSSEPLRVSCQQQPTLGPLTMEHTPFRVIEDREGVYWIALDGRAYTSLARNINAMRLALNEARTIIAYYQSCLSEGGNGGQ